EAFARFLRRSPDTATSDDIRRFQPAQLEHGAQPQHGAQPPKMNGPASALRFFFTITARPRRPRPSAGPHGLSCRRLRSWSPLGAAAPILALARPPPITILPWYVTGLGWAKTL